jgi:polysaccharide export outer membrane protein
MLPQADPLARAARILAVAIALCVVFAAAGCGGARSASSPYIPPPEDPARAAWMEAIEELRANPDFLKPPAEYYLGPGDVLSVSIVGRTDVLGEDQRNGEPFRVTISENPNIVFPLIGSVRVHGKTPEQVRQTLTDAYGAVLRSPTLILTVEKFYQNQVTVLGSVKQPGRYLLEPGDTILDAVFKAGGLTLGGKTGDLPPARNLKILRLRTTMKDRADRTAEELLEMLMVDGQVVPREEFNVPLDEFLIGGDLSNNIPLVAGDIVYVPPAGTATVYGPVRSPKVVFLGPGLRTLGDVINECGNLRFKAASRVEVVRQVPGNETRSFFLNARRIMKRKDQDFILQDSDRVYVYADGFRSILDGIGSVFKATASTGVNATYNPVP